MRLGPGGMSPIDPITQLQNRGQYDQQAKTLQELFLRKQQEEEERRRMEAAQRMRSGYSDSVGMPYRTQLEEGKTNLMYRLFDTPTDQQSLQKMYSPTPEQLRELMNQYNSERRFKGYL